MARWVSTKAAPILIDGVEVYLEGGGGGEREGLRLCSSGSRSGGPSEEVDLEDEVSLCSLGTTA